jgi:AraC-like DNA-binding protein
LRHLLDLSQTKAVAAAPGQPRAFARHFTSPEEYAAFNGLADIRINCSAPRDFTADMAVMDLGGVRIKRGGASIGLNLIGVASNNHTFTFATAPAHPRLMAGREVPHDVLFHPRPNEVLTTRSPSNTPFPWGAITMSCDDLAQAGSSLTGRDVGPSRVDAAILRTRPAAHARLLKLVADAARLAATTPEVADSPAAAAAFSGVLLDALIECLGHAAWEPDRAAARQHHRVMARLDTLLRENSDALLSRSALCRAVGASERTLHAVCMEFVGMAPMRYIRRHRLGFVREALLGANFRAETVTEIAMRHGFWEASRFSAAYREAFGETPSATRRRG